VEKAFKVKVTNVNVMTVPGRRRTLGRRAKVAGAMWKKAIVTLQPGDKIELFEATK
jgi:large subunit ribosomal protein L23